MDSRDAIGHANSWLKRLNAKSSVRIWLMTVVAVSLFSTVYGLYSDIDAGHAYNPPTDEALVFLKRVSKLYDFPDSQISHIDEPYWMHGTYAYYLIKSGDFSSRYWQNPANRTLEDTSLVSH
jgi:hypothetical protein